MQPIVHFSSLRGVQNQVEQMEENSKVYYKSSVKHMSREITWTYSVKNENEIEVRLYFLA